ncbi:putative ribonuclease H-like domain-containing protein [Tanacetum coccineum]
MAFVSSPSSTNELNTAYGVSTANTQKTGRKIIINGSDTAGYDKSKVECFNCHKMGHFSRECRGARNQDTKNRNQDNSRRTVNMEDTSFKATMAIDGAEEFQKPEFEGYGPKTSKSVSKDISNKVWESPDASLVEELVSDDKLEKKTAFPANIEFVKSKQQEKPVRKPVQYAEMYRLTTITIKGKGWNIVVRAVLMESGLRPLNTARPVNTAHPKTTVYSARPMSCFSKSAQSTVNAVKASACWVRRPTKHDSASITLKRHNYVDARGRSKHMTCNMSYLSDFKEFDGGYVTFRGGAKGGKITGKGTLKTSKLDFEDLANESQVLLKVPRKNNMYSVDMKNIIPKESLTSLVAKATLDESMLWHRRLGSCRTPALSFMRPFGCHVTILNTLDYLGKFDCKSDDRFFVGYLLNSKAFRVYNIRTRKVEENLHIRFLGDKPIIVGDGLNWLFDIDILTKSMNYVLVVAGTNSNDFVGTKESIGAGHSNKETRSSQYYILMPLWKDGSLFDSSSKNASNDEPQPSSDAGKKDGDGVSKESRNDDQEKPENNSQDVNTVEPSINTEQELISLGNNTTLEATHHDYFDDETEVDMSNITNTYPVPSTPNTRIHKDHSLDHVIGDVLSGVQTRRMTNKQGFISAVYEGKTHEDLHTCLFACLLSQEEPKRVAKSLSDSTWVEAMQEELLYLCFLYGIYGISDECEEWFPYGQIEREVYVCQPSGFEDLDYPNKVCKVVKALYGLHQAPRAWYETLAKYLLDNGFHRGKIDHTLFIKEQNEDILLIQVYVDDIIFGSTKKELCTEFEKLMHDKFQMSSMGELTFFLRLQVKQKEDEIFISQDKYVAEILRKFSFTDVRTASTPMDTKKPLLKDSNGDVLMFISIVKSILRYLKGQPKLGLWYPRDSPFDLLAYSDSDYAGASLDRKSTIGGCQFLGCRLISWQCKKQTVVATSSTEAEYVAAASCYGQVLWIQNQMLDYRYVLTANPTIYVSLIKQFWQTATAKTLDNREIEITATIDGIIKTVTEASVRRHLQLADADGISSLPTTKIFEQLSLMGYLSTSDTLTFQKGHFSSQ